MKKNLKSYSEPWILMLFQCVKIDFLGDSQRDWLNRVLACVTALITKLALPEIWKVIFTVCSLILFFLFNFANNKNGSSWNFYYFYYWYLAGLLLLLLHSRGNNLIFLFSSEHRCYQFRLILLSKTSQPYYLLKCFSAYFIMLKCFGLIL